MLLSRYPVHEAGIVSSDWTADEWAAFLVARWNWSRSRFESVGGHLLTSSYEGAKELGVFIFPIYSLLNGEPRSYLEFPNHLLGYNW